MSEAIIIALITGGITLGGNLISNYSSRKKDAIAQAKRDQKLDDQIATMNKKLDEHNQYSDRIGNIEKAIVRINTTLSERKNNERKD